MVFMVCYHDIIANDSNIFLNSTIMYACFKQRKWREKMKSFFFLTKNKLYITNLIWHPYIFCPSSATDYNNSNNCTQIVDTKLNYPDTCIWNRNYWWLALAVASTVCSVIANGFNPTTHKTNPWLSKVIILP